MRIGVISDTHGNHDSLRKALEQMGKVDLIIHAGDHYKDALNLGKESGIKVVAVIGNCDWHVTGPAEQELEIEGFRILVTHGHTYGVKSNNLKLADKLRKENYHLIIYGHSHVPEVTRLPNGYLLNPGSPSSPRRGNERTFAVVEISKKGIAPYIHQLKW